MKKVLKFAGSLIIGMCMGAAGVILGISWFTGTSLTAFLEHLKIETLLSSMFISLISLFIAGYLQIILHEAGHLLFGLAVPGILKYFILNFPFSLINVSFPIRKEINL